MNLKQTTLVVLLSFIGLTTVQGQLIRKPAISPDASQMAFSYYGDIWVYNLNSKDAKRLTIHKAYETDPVWNPKGNQIAFTSDRKGNSNIFTTSVNGGVPKQLTYYPTTNIPTSWDKNGDVIFTTRRIYAGAEWDLQLYAVN